MFIFTFPIKFDFSTIISFIIGLFFGIILILLIYVILVLLSLHDKRFIKKTEADTLTDNDVKNMIFNAQETFKDRGLRGDNSKVNFCKNICQDLAVEIASTYYPKSKRPLLELTLDEAIILIGYIQKRLDDLFNRKVLRLLLKLNISKIVSLSKTTLDFSSTKVFRATINANKKFQKIKKIINVINPAVWVRTFVVNNVVGIAINKICLIVIAIVGEETYKIYSKKVFNKDVEIASNVDNLVEELNHEIKNELKNLDNNYDDNAELKDDLHLLKRPYVISLDKKSDKNISKPNLEFKKLERN